MVMRNKQNKMLVEFLGGELHDFRHFMEALHKLEHIQGGNDSGGYMVHTKQVLRMFI